MHAMCRRHTGAFDTYASFGHGRSEQAHGRVLRPVPGGSLVNKKQTYETPRIVSLGSISDLTQAGGSASGTDFKCGSGSANPHGRTCHSNIGG